MIRGTTPTLEFNLPFDTSVLDVAYISISQDDNVVIEKQLSDCVVGETTLTVKLTQEDTLKLEARDKVEIQIRVRTKEGEALASNIKTTYAAKILKDGVI